MAGQSGKRQASSQILFLIWARSIPGKADKQKQSTSQFSVYPLCLELSLGWGDGIQGTPDGSPLAPFKAFEPLMGVEEPGRVGKRHRLPAERSRAQQTCAHGLIPRVYL